MASNGPLDVLSPKQRAVIAVVLLAIAGAVLAARGCRERERPPAPDSHGQTLANRNVRFGLPADAKPDPASRDAYLIDRPQYVLSYNDTTKNPNWVCWNLTASDIGPAERDTSFEPDPELPPGFARVKPSDYTATGFDRGHMCASKDRSDTKENNNILFYMTNIVPQAPNNNQKAWRLLEEECRSLAKKGNELYIACGPHGRSGTGKDNTKHDFIGKGTKVEVPATVWKVILVLPSKDAVPDAQTRAVAVWMPNDQTVGTDWKRYVVPVAEVERNTGYKFFPVVPDDVAHAIKSHADTGP